MIGRPLHKKRFIHILDELTLDILLTELDTVSDFANYLTKKEEFLSNREVDLIITGEEELLAVYFSHPLPDYDGFSFPQLPPSKMIAFIKEGMWSHFYQSQDYDRWKKKIALSYEWDRLIEHQ